MNHTILLIFVAAIWGLTFSSVKLSLNALSTFELITIRSVLALLFGHLFLKQNFKEYFSKQLWKHARIPSIILFLTTLLQTYGLEFTTPARSAFFTSMSFLFVPIFTYFFSSKSPKINYYIAAIIGLTGIATLYQPNLREISTGDGLTILSSVGYAAYFFSLSKCRNKFNSSSLFGIQMLVMIIASTPFALINSNFNFQMDTITTLAVLFTGIFGTGLSYYLLIKCQGNVKPETTSFILSLEPIFASISALIVFSDVPTFEELFGFILIFIAVLIHEKIIDVRTKNQQ